MSAERLVEAALERIVNHAFDPPTKRHKRSGWAVSKCDITCQPCALEQGRLALAALAKERAVNGPSMVDECGNMKTAESI